MPQTDWNAEAKRAANHFGENHMQAHRGAAPWQTLGVCVAFGNDDYANDERTKREVERFRELIAAAGVEELGFGLGDEDGYTWAMIVQTDQSGAMNDFVWQAWRDVTGGGPADAFEAVQRGKALAAITDDANAPTASVN